MNQELFQVQATIQGVRTMVDGGLRVTVDTQELEPVGAAKLLGLKGKLGWLLFAENPIEQVEVPSLTQAQKQPQEKSWSQKLRAVLYRFWEQEATSVSFEDFYQTWMANKIEELKDCLNDPHLS